jgi:PAP2 superfamily
MGSCWIDPSDSNNYTVGDVTITYTENEFRPTEAFPPSKWGSDFEALLGLADFTMTSWRDILYVPPPPLADSEFTRDEIKELCQLATKRPARLGEILAQDQNFQPYLVGQMMMSRRSHPRSYLAMKIAARVGEMLMAHYKMIFSRPRPVQVYPPLFPPCDTADHASYPSGHSLIAHLIAFAGADVFPPLREGITQLAHRIAHNREIAGFHYPSDTQVGQELAAAAFKLLKTTSYFSMVLGEAQGEWV